MSGTYIDCDVEHNDKDPKLKIGDQVRISKYKNIYEIIYTLNCSEEVKKKKKLKNAVPQTYGVSDFNVEGIVGTFYEKELQKTSQKRRFNKDSPQWSINVLTNNQETLLLIQEHELFLMISN